MKKTGLLSASTLALAIFLTAGSAFSADYPTKPIRVIVPLPPGGASDMLARTYGEKLLPILGQPLLIDNRPGAGGMVGTAAAATSAPDGYTLVLGSATMHSIIPNVRESTPYRSERDFTPIAIIATVPLAISAVPSFPANTLKELIEYAKTRPGEIAYGTEGAATTAHLGAEILQAMTGIKLLHVPFQGNAPLMQAMLSGTVQLAYSGADNPIRLAKSGRLKMIATAEPERLKATLDVPTINETAPGAEMLVWYAVFSPKGTSPAIVKTLADAFTRVAADPSVITTLRAGGIEAKSGSGEEVARRVREDTVKYLAIIKSANINLQ